MRASVQSLRTTKKLVVRITTVDPTTRTVQGALKDGGSVPIAVWETSPIFRWPQTGEDWTIYYENGIPHLGQRYERIETFPVEQVPVGGLKLDASSIYDALGNKLMSGSGIFTPKAATAAVNNELYVDSSTFKLAFKDHTGTVHALF